MMADPKPPLAGAVPIPRVTTAIEAAALAIVDKDLDTDEGVIPYAYKDSLGYLTIARGILIDERKGGKLFPEEIAFINRNRLGMLLAGVVVEPWYPAVANDPVRLAGILNMQFQLGSGSDEEFVTSFRYIAARNWPLAAANLRKSKWARQTPARTERVIAMIETGKHA
jgi:lysozyme